MHKKLAAGAVIAAIVVLTVAAWLVHNQFSNLQTRITELQTRNSELQNQNSDLQNRVSQLLEQYGENYSSPVKIVVFVWGESSYPIVCVTLYHPVNVTIRNFSAVNVSGLSLNVRLIDNHDGDQIGKSGGANIDLLQAGEKREIKAGVYFNVGTSLTNAACVVTLYSGNTVLDEWTRNIS